MTYMLPKLPHAIDHAEVMAFLERVGIDTHDLIRFTVTRGTLTVTVHVLDADGRAMVRQGMNETVQQDVVIPIAEARKTVA